MAAAVMDGVPPFVLYILGGVMGGVLLASFVGLDHVADEMLYMGAVAGVLLFASSMPEVARSQIGRGGWN